MFSPHTQHTILRRNTYNSEINKIEISDHEIQQRQCRQVMLIYCNLQNISKPMFMIRNTIKFKRIYANLVVYRQDRDGLTCASKKKNHL